MSDHHPSTVLPEEGDVLLDIYYYEKDLSEAHTKEEQQIALDKIKQAEDLLVEIRSAKN